MNRRSFVAATSAAAFAQSPALPVPDFPVIDTHIHLFDVSRQGGIPWPPSTNKVLYKTALPDRYRKLALPFGIKGAIEVECSPQVEDNQWVLDVAAKDTIIVGTVGNLEPGKPGFGRQLERFTKNPLFRGIRYGTLWGRKFHEEMKRAEFFADVKLLAAANMTLDAAIASPRLIADLVRLTDRVANLRVVINHLPQLDPPTGAGPLREYEANLKELSGRGLVYVKLSAVLRRVDGKVPLDLAFYRPRLDHLVEVFGEDRVLYGSDWPNSDQWAAYPQVFGIVRDYFMARGRSAAEKYFWKNSVKAYQWVKRAPDQPRYVG